jgi:hypothetical protein
MALHEAAIEAGSLITDGQMERSDMQGVRANARWLAEHSDKALGDSFQAEDFVKASARVQRALPGMSESDVERVRGAARRALALAIQELGRSHLAQAAEDAHLGEVAVKFRDKLKVERDACTAWAMAAEPAAERYARQALAQARLDATVEMARAVLDHGTCRLLMDTLGLTAHYDR